MKTTPMSTFTDTVVRRLLVAVSTVTFSPEHPKNRAKTTSTVIMTKSDYKQMGVTITLFRPIGRLEKTPGNICALRF